MQHKLLTTAKTKCCQKQCILNAPLMSILAVSAAALKVQLGIMSLLVTQYYKITLYITEERLYHNQLYMVALTWELHRCKIYSDHMTIKVGTLCHLQKRSGTHRSLGNCL